MPSLIIEKPLFVWCACEIQSALLVRVEVVEVRWAYFINMSQQNRWCVVVRSPDRYAFCIRNFSLVRRQWLSCISLKFIEISIKSKRVLDFLFVFFLLTFDTYPYVQCTLMCYFVLQNRLALWDDDCKYLKLRKDERMKKKVKQQHGLLLVPEPTSTV